MSWACHPNPGKSYIFEDFEDLVDHNADRMNKFATTAWNITTRAVKSDFWKSFSKAAAQGALSRLYPPFA